MSQSIAQLADGWKQQQRRILLGKSYVKGERQTVLIGYGGVEK